MAAYIWSASRLEELLNHSQSSVAGWAAAKLFHLYPANFQSRLPQLLKDNRPEVVQKSLDLVGRAHREELIPLLKDLYLNGTEKVSARAIRLLGDWSCALAVQWMRERILAEAPLSKEQIAAMIYALGRIPDEDAYTLLKQTETAVEGKDSSHWDLFYASLLEHHRAEDVEFLLKAVFAEDRKEERRRNALGLLLAQVDPELNPTDVFFANRPAVERHILKRLERIDAAAEADSKKLFDSVRQALPLMERECARVADVLNAAAAEVRQWDRYAGLAGDVLGLTLETLREKPGVDKWRYGAACLAVSALIGVIEESVFQQPQPGSHWRQKLEYLLRDRPPHSTDQILVEKIIEQADRQELIYTLRERLENQPESWGALRSLEILGTMGAPETADLMVAMLGKIKDELAVQAVQSALLRIGLPAVPLLIARLDSVHAPEAWTILDLLSQLPTREGVQSIV
ncbi:MAG: hypothetical protein RBS57_10795, partial [Desulforhabdus sp.]|nr:hypothetical protein [Desulforhabdus sp.]